MIVAAYHTNPMHPIIYLGTIVWIHSVGSSDEVKFVWSKTEIRGSTRVTDLIVLIHTFHHFTFPYFLFHPHLAGCSYGNRLPVYLVNIYQKRDKLQ